jgi:hypothetical protein
MLNFDLPNRSFYHYIGPTTRPEPLWYSAIHVPLRELNPQVINNPQLANVVEEQRRRDPFGRIQKVGYERRARPQKTRFSKD